MTKRRSPFLNFLIFVVVVVVVVYNVKITISCHVKTSILDMVKNESAVSVYYNRIYRGLRGILL